MGEVYKPEDIICRKSRSSDLSPNLNGVIPSALQDVISELRLLRAEVNKVKKVLRTNGIVID